MLDIQTVLVFIVVFCAVAAYWNARRPSGLPPGPPGYPFVGNLPILWGNKHLHLTLHKYKQQYGPLVSLQLGWYAAVVISCPRLLQEAMVKYADSFSNRPIHFFFIKIIGTDKGIINNHGPIWKSSRRMAISAMRDFGVGKSSIEAKVQEEAQAIVQEINKREGRPIHVEHIFSKASANVIFSMLFSKRYEYDDKEFINLLDKLSKFFYVASQLNTSLLLPYMLPIAFVEPVLRNATKLMFTVHSYVRQQIKEHRQTFDSNNIRDFVDIYLSAEMEESGDKAVSEDNIFFTISDLLMAGTETTSTTMRWAVYFMITHPHVQDMCIQHIHQEIGEREVSMSDKDKLPYIEATLCEIQRFASITPHSVLHCTNGPVDFQGYRFPDKTIIIPDLYSIHMDPTLWHNPDQFNPDRFINEEGKVHKPTYFLPFSLGKRICAGENLARTELFIFFTTLLKKFRFSARPGDTLPDRHKICKLGLTLYPLPFEAMATPL